MKSSIPKNKYNRSAVPRIITKLGDREYEKYGKEKMEEARMHGYLHKLTQCLSCSQT